MNKGLEKTALSLSVGLAMGLAGSANALPFFGGNTLSIDPGAVVLGPLLCTHDTATTGGICYSTALGPSSLSGSYFLVGAGMFGVTFVEGFDGIKIGVGQPAGSASHPGLCVATDTGAVTKGWNFFMSCGHEFTVGTGVGASAATSDPNALSTSGTQTLGLPHPNVDGHHFLDFSNWRFAWIGRPTINMGGGFQDCGTSTDGVCDIDGTDPDFPDQVGTYFNGSGLAHIECFTDSAHTTPQVSCSASSFYVAEYAAIVPQGHPSRFGGVLYELRLTGQVDHQPTTTTTVAPTTTVMPTTTTTIAAPTTTATPVTTTTLPPGDDTDDTDDTDDSDSGRASDSEDSDSDDSDSDRDSDSE